MRRTRYRVGGGGGEGSGGGQPNVTEHADVGIDLQTHLDLSGESTPVDLGVEVGIGPLAIATPVEMGLSTLVRVDADTRDATDIGLEVSPIMTLQGQSTPVDTGARIVKITYDLTRLSGANAVAEEAVVGRTDWASDTNATGKHDEVVATIAGNALGARGGRLVLDYAAFVDKTVLVIDSVKLHFYTAQAGTIAGNGDFKHQWRRTSTDAWTTLATFTGNQDSQTTPATYDITASIEGWNALNSLQAGVSFESAVAEVQTASADAVEIEVVAHLYDDPTSVSGLAAWYKADRLVDVLVNDGNPVSTWKNSEGTAARDLGQAVAANRAVYKLNIINGKPVARFDGVNDFLSVASAFLVGQTGSAFVVVRFAAMTLNQTLWSSCDEASNTRFVQGYVDGASNDQLVIQQINADTADNVRGGSALTTATNYILEWHSNGSSFERVVNGVVQSVTITSGVNNGDWFGDTTARDNFNIGAYIGLSSPLNLLNGDLAEAIFYDAVSLDAEKKATVRNYLADKYAITV